jgi:hypothetical protein
VFIRAAFELLGFVEAIDDETFDPDDAVRATENFLGELQACRAEELLSYAAVADALRSEAEGGPDNAYKEPRVDFFSTLAGELRGLANEAHGDSG